MVRENIRFIPPSAYLREREVLEETEMALFDALYLTGGRISEILMSKKVDYDFDIKRVFLHTLKNPGRPMRMVRMLPQLSPLVSNLKSFVEKSPDSKLWSFSHRAKPRTYVWEVSRKVFGCPVHSFRHTHATILSRDFRANLNELMNEMGWKDPKPATIYIQYQFSESLEEKVNEYYQRKGNL